MTDSRTDPQHAARSIDVRSEVPDVWFSSPPDEEALEETPHAAGIQILFTSPTLETR